MWRRLATFLVAGSWLSALLWPHVAFADHESRGRTLSGQGIDPLLVALVIGAAVLALALFAAVILWWERADQHGESSSHEASEGDASPGR
jgi:multisubunit Na+/H+ antiporter MnhC subunit